ncbi:hypothetical protein [Mesomycoplasma ovipneumoniae]|uniref:hypothetical protein n=1 Tax=Mesomycoplasma ovipneumoniae TaxID=29562 RepID=UPI00311AE8D9
MDWRTNFTFRKLVFLYWKIIHWTFKVSPEKNQKISKFNWQIVEINDEKYKKLVQKYQFDPQVICHNDLQFKNIIVSKTIN